MKLRLLATLAVGAALVACDNSQKQEQHTPPTQSSTTEHKADEHKPMTSEAPKAVETPEAPKAPESPEAQKSVEQKPTEANKA